MNINTTKKHVQLNPRDPAFYENPYPIYERLRRQVPMFFWEESGVWTFVNHADVSAILRDRRFGRKITPQPNETLNLPPRNPDHKPFYDVDDLSMLDLEPPDHTRIRGLVQKAFMSRQIERLRPQIAALSHQLIDQLEAQAAKNGAVDLLQAFATPIPVITIAAMLGVPTSKADDLLRWSHAMVTMYQMGRSAEQEQAAVKAAQAFVAYLRGYVNERRADPQDDLISLLISAEEQGEKLTEDELISNCILLLNAGHEATVNVIGNGLVALLQNPAQLAGWREGRVSAETAVEELLRYDTPLHLFKRWVLEDVELHGQTLKRGSEVALLLGAANRDPQQFERADALDLGRKRNQHVSLGGGIHYCLGAPLARLELQTALPILLNRLPNLRLAEPPTVTDSYHFRGLEQLLIAI